MKRGVEREKFDTERGVYRERLSQGMGGERHTDRQTNRDRQRQSD